jgi:choline dehydrogenase-like flavoprotein
VDKEISRREFVKQTVVGTAVLAGTSSAAIRLAAAGVPADVNKQVVAALGEIFIPSKAGDPGYKDLESFGITDYAMKSLSDGVFEIFNGAAKQFFDGKAFLELDGQRREEYLELIIDGNKITDAQQRVQLQTFYRATRARILQVYYKNYPENELKRNEKGELIFKPGDTHQISDPNTKKLVTGWDVAEYSGPMSWEEEEHRRAMMKKALPYWYEGDLVKLTNASPAAPAIKTSSGRDYYDVLVVGGGTAGCIVAGRLAERGMNPKTGDRLRVAMIEGGDDWTIRAPGLLPGHGYPTVRRMVSNLDGESTGPEGSPPTDPACRWNYAGSNFKMVGGCSVHYGGVFHIPGEDDFRCYRQVGGVDWTLPKFEEAIQEIRNFFPINVFPSELMSKGARMFAEAGASLGYEMRPAAVARRNCLACRQCGVGKICRQDSKATSLPWAYIGLNNGLKVIANAEVDRILIEKSGSSRPVATGVVYKDKAGQMHEVRAARIIVATGAVGTPLLLYRSGYGPREYLGAKTIVENNNIGRHFDVDLENAVTAYFPDSIPPETDAITGGMWTTIKPKPWGELTVQIDGGNVGSLAPHNAAVSQFAPQFGWKHKEYMRHSAGRYQFGVARNVLQFVPWEWRVTPDGQIQQIRMDEAKINATSKQAAELTQSIFEKMAVKPVQIQQKLVPPHTFVVGPFGHETGTARAGARVEDSVCTSDFDCHDIDHLMFTSTAALPRTLFSHGCGPAMVFGAYAWRRFVENHFSRGNSTEGYA